MKFKLILFLLFVPFLAMGATNQFSSVLVNDTLRTSNTWIRGYLGVGTNGPLSSSEYVFLPPPGQTDAYLLMQGSSSTGYKFGTVGAAQAILESESGVNVRFDFTNLTAWNVRIEGETQLSMTESSITLGNNSTDAYVFPGGTMTTANLFNWNSGQLIVNSSGMLTNTTGIVSLGNVFVSGNFGVGSSSIANNNLTVIGGGSIASSTSSTLLFSGAPQVKYRLFERGSVGSTLSVSDSYASHIIGDQAMTEAASGSHSMLSQFVVKPLVITGGAATVSNAATVYIPSASGVTVIGRDDALRVGGTTFFESDATGLNSISASNIVGTSVLATHATPTSANFFSVGGLSGSRQSGSPVVFSGSSVVGFRTTFVGSSNYGLVADDSYGSVIVGNNSITEAASGNHNMLANLVVRPITVTAGVATVSNAATLYVVGPTIATVIGRNDTLRVGGTSLFESNITIGATTAFSTPINLSGSTNFTWTPGSISTLVTAVTNMSVAGILRGSSVEISPNVFTSGLIWRGYCTNDGVVTATINNFTLGSIDPGAHTNHIRFFNP